MCKHTDIRGGVGGPLLLGNTMCLQLFTSSTGYNYKMNAPAWLHIQMLPICYTYGVLVHVHVTLLCRCTSWIIYQMKTGGTRMSQSQKTRSWSGQMSGAHFPHQTFQMGILFPSLCVWMRKQTVTSVLSLQVCTIHFGFPEWFGDVPGSPPSN